MLLAVGGSASSVDGTLRDAASATKAPVVRGMLRCLGTAGRFLFTGRTGPPRTAPASALGLLLPAFPAFLPLGQSGLCTALGRCSGELMFWGAQSSRKGFLNPGVRWEGQPHIGWALSAPWPRVPGGDSWQRPQRQQSGGPPGPLEAVGPLGAASRGSRRAPQGAAGLVWCVSPWRLLSPRSRRREAAGGGAGGGVLNLDLRCGPELPFLPGKMKTVTGSPWRRPCRSCRPD